MFSRTSITKSTGNYSENIKRLKEALDTAEAVVIGAGAGLSTAAGFTYSGERFKKHFADFIDKYGFSDMYSGGFYPFEAPEEFWAYWSRYIFINRYMDAPKPVYDELFELVKCGCFTRRATTGFFNAPFHAVMRRSTTRKSYAKWSMSKQICVFPPNYCRFARTAEIRLQ